jgi:hypothetical protein
MTTEKLIASEKITAASELEGLREDLRSLQWTAILLSAGLVVLALVAVAR